MMDVATELKAPELRLVRLLIADARARNAYAVFLRLGDGVVHVAYGGSIEANAPPVRQWPALSFALSLLAEHARSYMSRHGQQGELIACSHSFDPSYTINLRSNPWLSEGMLNAMLTTVDQALTLLRSEAIEAAEE